MHPTKACPVVLRSVASGAEVLVFRHPRAGVQLVKGTIEPGEPAAAAAVRELREESGVLATCGESLGVWDSGYDGQIWAFFEMQVEQALPSKWRHRAPDDGGHEFEFFWHRFVDAPTGEWHPLFVGALEFLRRRLGGSSHVIAGA